MNTNPQIHQNNTPKLLRTGVLLLYNVFKIHLSRGNDCRFEEIKRQYSMNVKHTVHNTCYNIKFPRILQYAEDLRR